MAQKA